MCGNNLNRHTHTYTYTTHFRRSSPVSFIYQWASDALSNGHSLVACFRGMEFTVREREQAREGGVRAREMVGGWHLNGEEKLWEVIRCCVLNVERCWRKYVMKKWKENLATLLMYHPSTSERTRSRYCWLSQGRFCLCSGLVWFCGLIFRRGVCTVENGLSNRPCSHYAHPGGGCSFLDCSWILVLPSADTHFWIR